MVNNRHAAPGTLELVRRFLNTWVIANQTHAPEDRLPKLASNSRAWRDAFGAPRPQTAAERQELLRLRSDLRQMLPPAPPDPMLLNQWLDRIPIRPRACDDSVVHEPLQPRLAGLVLAAVIDAVTAGQWPRLKACHDCQWVFYDWTRNASRRWCGMKAEGPEGRACGSIAKVRRYRNRQRAAHEHARPGQAGNDPGIRALPLTLSPVATRSAANDLAAHGSPWRSQSPLTSSSAPGTPTCPQTGWSLITAVPGTP